MIARLLAPLLALFAALPVQAEPRLVAALSGDWNGDGRPDAVLLYGHDDGMADLVVMLGHDWLGLQPAIHLPQVIYYGTMAGQVPALEPRSASSFAVLSEQTGIGREPWQAVLTVAYRQDALRVAGYDFHFYDRLDPTHHGRCSVNLLTGAFELHRGPGNDAPEVSTTGRGTERAFPLADLAPDWQPAACAALWQ